MEYKTIRSNRRILTLEIRKDGLIVCAPIKATDEEINAFVVKHKRWIKNRLLKIEERKKELESVEPLSQSDIQALADKALQVIPERVKHYAEKIGVTYGRITIRNQRSRWGSCSAKGNLNFNCLLMLVPKAGAVSCVFCTFWIPLYVRMAKKQFGGVTGDTAGFFLQICELVCLAGTWIGGQI